MKKYERIRRKLLNRRNEIEDRLNKVDQDILHTNGAPSPDSGEQAIERENDDVLEALGGIARSELEQINIALSAWNGMNTESVRYVKRLYPQKGSR